MHTPGPWQIQNDGLGVYYVNPQIEAGDEDICDPAHDSPIARVDCDYSGVDYDAMLANTRLIAAAPELLEAARMALEYCERVMRPDAAKTRAKYLEPLRAAITKAEGR